MDVQGPWSRFSGIGVGFRDGPGVALQSKAGRPLGRYFPEVVARVAALGADCVAVDGALMPALLSSLPGASPPKRR